MRMTKEQRAEYDAYMAPAHAELNAAEAEFSKAKRAGRRSEKYEKAELQLRKAREKFAGTLDYAVSHIFGDDAAEYDFDLPEWMVDQ